MPHSSTGSFDCVATRVCAYCIYLLALWPWGPPARSQRACQRAQATQHSDQCGMTDEILAQILDGIIGQTQIDEETDEKIFPLFTLVYSNN